MGKAEDISVLIGCRDLHYNISTCDIYLYFRCDATKRFRDSVNTPAEFCLVYVPVYTCSKAIHNTNVCSMIHNGTLFQMFHIHSAYPCFKYPNCPTFFSNNPLTMFIRSRFYVWVRIPDTCHIVSW